MKQCWSTKAQQPGSVRSPLLQRSNGSFSLILGASLQCDLLCFFLWAYSAVQGLTNGAMWCHRVAALNLHVCVRACERDYEHSVCMSVLGLNKDSWWQLWSRVNLKSVTCCNLWRASALDLKCVMLNYYTMHSLSFCLISAHTILSACLQNETRWQYFRTDLANVKSWCLLQFKR